MTEYTTGPDVSYAQGANFPWVEVVNAGHRFALVRAGRAANDGSIARDERYFGNVNRARELGLLTGSYWYMHSTASATEQAAFFASVLAEGDAHLDHYGPWLDVEEDTITGQMISDFYAEFESSWPYVPLGWSAHWPSSKLGVYTSQHKWSKVQGASAFDMNNHPLWCADWGDVSSPRLPSSWDSWLFWQYTSKASVDGYGGPVDMNRLNPSIVPGGEVPKQATLEESAYHCLQQAEHNLEEAARFMRQAREEAAT